MLVQGMVLSLLPLFGQMNIKGVCLTGPPRPIDAQVMDEIKATGAGWVCLMPYAYGPDEQGALVRDIGDRQWWGERSDGVEALIRMAHDKGLKVMLKPHLWLGHGDFTGNFDLDDPAKWERFELSYHSYVIDHAGLAQRNGADLLCIGTELSTFVRSRPNFWTRLITDVRKVYSGKITYAANWDEVWSFPFWDRLDRIGVDAYFPLSDAATPTVATLEAAWLPHWTRLELLADSLGKNYLFCEIGYRSCAGCAATPWVHDEAVAEDLTCQMNAYAAFLNTAASTCSFDGCFLWKWFAAGHLGGRHSRTGYTPQSKPAMEVVRSGFAR